MLNGLNVKALVGAFNQEKALVGAFSVLVQPVVEPMEHYYTALVQVREPGQHGGARAAGRAAADRRGVLPLPVPLLRHGVHPHLPHTHQVQLHTHAAGR